MAEIRFFDWRKRTFLQDVAETILELYQNETRLNLSGLVLALPGRRAVLDMEQILYDRIESQVAQGRTRADWIPPTLLTVGQLPELLYPLKRPLAGSLTQWFAWRIALISMADQNPGGIHALLPHGISDEFQQQIALARILTQLHAELAADGKTFADVLAKSQEQGIKEEIQRWQTLDSLQKHYLSLLDEQGLWDVQTARMEAIRRSECQTDREIFLIGTSDLNRIQKELFRTVDSHLHCYVYAPETERNRFDEFGCLRYDQWRMDSILREDSLRSLWDEMTIDRIRCFHDTQSQAKAVVQFAQNLAQEQWPNSAEPVDSKQVHEFLDNMTLCVPEDFRGDFIPQIKREFDRFNLTISDSAGELMSQNRVFRLLRLLAGFTRERQFTALATFMRHPDIERYITDRWSDGPNPELPSGDWLTQCDHWQNRFLPWLVDWNWQPPVPSADHTQQEDFSLFLHVVAILQQLLEPFVPLPVSDSDQKGQESKLIDDDNPNLQSVGEILNHLPLVQIHKRESERTLVDWCELISTFVYRVCSSRMNQNEMVGVFEDTVRHQLETGIIELHKILDELAEVPETLLPILSGYDIITLILNLLEKKQTPHPSIENAIQLVGWLDLRLDHAKFPIIVGMNEGAIPSSFSNDLFLPDAFRRMLDMDDSRRRFARDAYTWSALIASRPQMIAMFGRHNTNNDSIQPSRFLFMSQQERLAEKVCLWFDSQENDIDSNDETAADTAGMASHVASKNTSQFVVPVLKMSGPPPKYLRVTEFADFLACPYRWFLKYAERLQVERDDQMELDNAWFGTITHEILSRFGNHPDMVNCIDSKVLSKFLSNELDHYVWGLFHNKVGPVVHIQVEEIRKRLYYFAEWQAKWRAAGNVIRFVEQSPAEDACLFDDRTPVIRLHGKIDRIDYNPDTGQWFVFDYKTYKKGEIGNGISIPLPGQSEFNFDPELLTRKFRNKPDKNHRKSDGSWTDLQLPLYRLIFHEIMREHGMVDQVPEPLPGYIVLQSHDRTLALAAPWSELDMKLANQTAVWVAKTILRLWPLSIDPYAPIDPNSPGSGTILSAKVPHFMSDFAPITLENRFK